MQLVCPHSLTGLSRDVFSFLSLFSIFHNKHKSTLSRKRQLKKCFCMCSWGSLYVLGGTAEGRMGVVCVCVQDRKKVEQHLANLSTFQTTCYSEKCIA